MIDRIITLIHATQDDAAQELDLNPDKNVLTLSDAQIVKILDSKTRFHDALEIWTGFIDVHTESNGPWSVFNLYNFSFFNYL